MAIVGGWGGGEWVVLKTLGGVMLCSHHRCGGWVGVGSREQHVCCRAHFMNIMVLINT